MLSKGKWIIIYPLRAQPCVREWRLVYAACCWMQRAAALAMGVVFGASHHLLPAVRIRANLAYLRGFVYDFFLAFRLLARFSARSFASLAR